jgi:RNA recognition motif-containing protein
MSFKDHNKRNSVFVRNLPLDASEEQLKDMFTDYGQILDVFIPRDKYSGRHKNFAFVEFSALEHAERAVKRVDGT